MTKLKTVKEIIPNFSKKVDIDKLREQGLKYYKVSNIGLKILLRKEAIKWIKLFSKCNALQRTVLAYDYHITNPGGIATWIKHFFNIEEKDWRTKG